MLTIADCASYLRSEVFKYSSAQHSPSSPNWPGHVGLEIEMLPFSSTATADAAAIPVTKIHPQVSSCLRNLATRHNWQILEEKTADGEKLLTKLQLDSQGGNISFEPGGQLEISPHPNPSLVTSQKKIQKLQRLLELELNARGIYLTQLGINPWHSCDELGIQIPKPRYTAMSRYFSSQSGCRMMRKTLSQQVCLDFGDTSELLARRYLGAQLLAPIAAAIFCYSPVVNGRIGKYRSHRIDAWTKLDHFRTGFVGVDALCKAPTRQTCIDHYLDYALRCPVVYIKALDYFVPDPRVPFHSWINSGINGNYPQLEDFVDHLSLLFPEVRPRGYLELRSIDGQSRIWQNVPALFACGLLYIEENLDFTIATLSPYRERLADLMAKAASGLDDQEIASLAAALMKKSLEGVQKLPDSFYDVGSYPVFLEFSQHFTGKNRTPADDLSDCLLGRGGKVPSLQDIVRLEEQWQELIS